ncbi:putative murein hydrolase LrgA protein [Alteracholeplasma palmae J233]|uniref:Putative murein hydrolase LrgA protein n=1 Tax=Alteracholeplasma palmae (strain ATCC 49389 / J233) TaxID=1318466 RepID=U4KP21_ALTPJ|nr:CidA/LrgA family protein [Alteracholeplasma palmae]CCV63945.1 putative murein hydrolase LrgA protein [Alteracholeplasma palmae J233]
MKILYQLSIIIGFTLLGELISSVLPFAFPGSIIGLILFFLALKFKIVKLEWVQETGSWLKNNLAFLFVPLTVAVMDQFDILKLYWLETIILLIVSTTVTLISSALIAKAGDKNE